LTARLLSGESCDSIYAATRARGLLPPLQAGTLAFDAACAESSAFARLVTDHQSETLEPLPFSLPTQGTTLGGVLKDVQRGRHLRWRCATMKGKDRLTLWCEHLILNSLETPGYPRESLLVCTDSTLTLPPLDNAPQLLADLVELYREGLCRPLHFFPQSSWLYLKDGMAKAAERWDGTDYSPSPAESSDPSLSLCCAGVDVLDDEFTSLAARVFSPIKAIAVEKKSA
jgi:exodeoxyribonuclease V gamma subunit